MVDISPPNQRARGLSDDQRIRLRDLETSSRLSEMEVGELHALKMCSNTEEAVRCDRVLEQARREAAANKTAKDYQPGLLGSTPTQNQQR